jgi:hypothetical protein
VKAVHRRRCLDPDCKRVFETTSPGRLFCCSAHAHRAHRRWYREGKQRALYVAVPVPPPPPETARTRAQRRAAEIGAKNRADPVFMAELHREMNEALERIKTVKIPRMKS